MTDPSDQHVAYSSTLLFEKSPAEAMAACRLRHQQLKEINHSLAEWLTAYGRLRLRYVDELKKLAAQGDTLFTGNSVPALQNDKIDSFGLCTPMWTSLLQTVHDECTLFDASTRKMGKDMIAPLKLYARKNDSNLGQMDHLEDVAAEIRDAPAGSDDSAAWQLEWSEKAPAFFDTFERYDFNRLILLKDVFLKYETDLSDVIANFKKHNESGTEHILSFTPDDEIRRYADAAVKTTFDTSDLGTASTAEAKAIAGAGSGSGSGSGSNSRAASSSTHSSSRRTTSDTHSVKRHSFLPGRRSSRSDMGGFTNTPTPAAVTTTSGSSNNRQVSSSSSVFSSSKKKDKKSMRSRFGTILHRKKKKHDGADTESIASSTILENASISSSVRHQESPVRRQHSPIRRSHTGGSTLASVSAPAVPDHDSRSTEASAAPAPAPTTLRSNEKPAVPAPRSKSPAPAVEPVNAYPTMQPTKHSGSTASVGAVTSEAPSPAVEKPIVEAPQVAATTEVETPSVTAPVTTEKSTGTSTTGAIGIGAAVGAVGAVAVGAVSKGKTEVDTADATATEGSAPAEPESVEPVEPVKSVEPIETETKSEVAPVDESVAEPTVEQPVVNKAPVEAPTTETAVEKPEITDTSMDSPIAVSAPIFARSAVPTPAAAAATTTSAATSAAKPPPPTSRKHVATETEASTVTSRSPHGSAPVPPVQRRSTVGPLEPANTGMLSSQSTGVSNNTTGGGGLRSGQIVHPSLTKPGLNASIVELFNASYKGGELVRSNAIGEVAFSYILDEPIKSIPQKIDLSISTHHGKKLPDFMVNTLFLQQDSQNPGSFVINDPSQINLRTVGGLKYMLNSPTPPLTIQPVWKHEATKSTVIISLKPSEELNEYLESNSLTFSNVLVSVSIQDATATSAATKPSGSFNREKARVTWNLSQPLEFNSSNREERLIARFMTNGVAKESESGVQVRYTVNNDEGGEAVSSLNEDLEIQAKGEDTVEDPFSSTASLGESEASSTSQWAPVPTLKTIVAGGYSGHS